MMIFEITALLPPRATVLETAHTTDLGKTATDLGCNFSPVSLEKPLRFCPPLFTLFHNGRDLAIEYAP